MRERRPKAVYSRVRGFRSDEDILSVEESMKDLPKSSSFSKYLEVNADFIYLILA
jgi:hypothetical protein